MRTEWLTVEEVKTQYRTYPYTLVYEISRMLSGRTFEIGDIRWDEVNDARFFGPDGEIHLYNDGDGIKAYKVSDDADDSILDVSYYLPAKFHFSDRKNEELVIREYFNYDEDGQAVVKMKRLVAVRDHG